MRLNKLALLALILFSAALVGAAEPDPGQGQEKGLDLTAQERAWLREHPVIRVGGPKAFPPFHYYEDGQGPAKGIAADYVALLARRLGLKVEYQPAMPWPEVLARVREHKLDVIACAAKSPDRESFLAFSRPYLSFPMVIVTQRDAPFVGGLEDLHGRRVALNKGVSTESWLQRDHIEVVPVPVNKPLEGLEAVSLGKADAHIENLAAAAFLMQKHALTNLKIAAPTSWGDYQLYFAVRKDWPILASILSKALASLEPIQLSTIRNNWITVRYDHGITTGDILKWGGLSLAVVGLGFLLLFLHTKSLGKEIAERKAAEAEREEVIQRLETALSDIKQLSGLLPICASCKKIRDDKGYWTQVEHYIQEHSEAEFSHSICPECLKALYPELHQRAEMGKAAKGA